MAQKAGKSALVFIIPLLVIGAAGAWYYKAHQPPTEDLDSLISDTEGDPGTPAKIEQWANYGIKYDQFVCGLHITSHVGKGSAGKNPKHATGNEEGEYMPLYFAAMQDNTKAMEIFLNHGAAADGKDQAGHTALYAACKNADVAAVKMLLDHKADPNAIGKDGESALVAVIDSTRESIHETDKKKAGEDAKKDVASKPERRREIVKMLLAAGADPNKGKKNGSTAVFQAFGDPETVKMLLDKGVKLDSTDDSGKTLLFVAQDKDLDNKILAAGVNPNKKMNDGRTALMWGIDAGAAEALIAKGADVNAKDNSGKTALHYLAESSGDVMPKAKLLLEHGAKWDEANNKGVTPFATATGANNKDLIALLQSKGVRPIPEHTPINPRAGGGAQ